MSGSNFCIGIAEQQLDTCSGEISESCLFIGISQEPRVQVQTDYCRGRWLRCKVDEYVHDGSRWVSILVGLRLHFWRELYVEESGDFVALKWRNAAQSDFHSELAPHSQGTRNLGY